MKKINLLILTFLISFINILAQEKTTYRSADEIYTKAREFHKAESYDKAYAEFLKVNQSDTAYFNSRLLAIQVAQDMSHYDTVKQVATEVLNNIIENPFKDQFLNILAHAHIQLEEYETAIEILDKAIVDYPRFYQYYYNLATCYDELGQEEKSLEAVQTSIRYNPNNYAAHYKLGFMCWRAGLLTKAALAMNMALYLEPTRSSNLIQVLQGIYSNSFEGKKETIKFREEEDFEDIDLLIKNKVASNKKYKIPVKLNYSFMRFNHLVFEQMEYDENSNNFWNQTYVRFFKEIMNNDHFANLSYYQSQAITEGKVQSTIKKNKSKIVDFYIWSIKLHTEYMNDRKIWNGSSYEENLYNHDGSYGFDFIATQKDDKIIGSYKGYHSNGNLQSEGNFNAEGKSDGLWAYYDEQGRKTAQANIKEDKLDGDRTTYYLNGSKKQKYKIKNDKIDGPILNYYSFNQKYSYFPYNEDRELDGKLMFFHKNGKMSDEREFKNGDLDGMFKKFHYNGKLQSEVKFIDGEKQGDYIEYFNDGNIYKKGQYTDNLPSGHWTFQFRNGQMYEEGDFKDGYRVGLWKAYNDKGKLQSESNYGETGKKTGVYKEYDLDGQLSFEYVYKGEDIISYKTYSPEGSVVTEGTKSKKKLNYISKFDNGVEHINGNFHKSNKTGTWTYKNIHNIITSEKNYNNDGELDGESKKYYTNGKTLKITTYKDGILDGYFVEYYRNGNISRQGWYKDGEPVGEWSFYNSNKTVSSTRYFLEGELHGYLPYYDEKGKISKYEKYYYGDFEGVIKMDTLGNEIGRSMLKDGAGTLTFIDFEGNKRTTKSFVGCNGEGKSTSYFSNGKISSEGQFINDERDGNWTWYNKEGTIITTGSYIDGERNGEWKWFHDNGKLSDISTYKYGNKEGVKKKYYENGKIEAEYYYRLDERHGKSTYYDELGQIQSIWFYKDGVRLGYSYIGKDGKPVEMIAYNGEKGNVTTYFQNGKKSYVCNRKDGYLNGENMYYSSNGNLSEKTFYKDNLEEGEYITYYVNGKVKSKSNYKDGELNGEKTEYFSNGKIKTVKHYIMDVLYGDHITYDTSGRIIEKANYYNGRKIN